MAAWDPLALNAFVFYDTEYTSWEGAMARNWSGPNEHRELVQLSAIRVRRWGTSSTHTQLPPTGRTRKLAGHVSLGTSATETTPLPRRDGELLIVDRLKLTVKPRLNPTLTEYFINLTGITQREVDEGGVTLPEALRRFKVFCGGAWSNFLPTASFGGDHTVLLENIELHDENADEALGKYTGWLRGHHDVVPFFVNSLGLDRAVFSSGTLHRAFGIASEEGTEARVHDSMWDITSVFLCLKLIDDANACGWQLELVDGGAGQRVVMRCALAAL